MRIVAYVLLALALLAFAYSARLYSLARSTPPVAGFGAGQAVLLCPIERPNCVSTENSESEFSIAALSYRDMPEQALSRLRAAILQEPRSRIVFADAGRLEASFSSSLFGFVDDAIFVLDQASGQVRMQSRSRVGYSDLGVNRARLARISARFSTP
jgi:uncharacterized protein (DUF1499 family)